MLGVYSATKFAVRALTHTLGMAAGTAAVLTTGTELCRRNDVERLYRDIRHGMANSEG